VTLNEVDAAKVKTGQKAVVTLDAIPDLEITGKVSSVDTLGTVSQGVVSYTIEIVFDSQDERIKPGMSVSASIITDVKTDVLMVPNAALKSANNLSYVLVPSAADLKNLPANSAAGVVLVQTPSQQTVEIGLTNDEYTEITSGLKQGETVVVGTTGSQTNSTRTQTQQNFRGGAGFIMR